MARSAARARATNRAWLPPRVEGAGNRSETPARSNICRRPYLEPVKKIVYRTKMDRIHFKVRPNE